MNGLWVVTMLGLGTVFLVLLFKSHAGFVHSFNQFAGSITGEPDTYNTVVQNAHKEGIDTSPAFSMDNTWPVWASICGLSLFGWLSIYISGEVRRARDTTQMKVMSLGAVVHIAIAAILAVLFFSTVRPRLLRRDQGSLGESYPFAAPPYYTFLTSIAGGSTLLAWWLFIAFAAAFPLLMIPNITIAVRTFFAWALDGLLPARFARVSSRTHAPNYAIGLTVALSIAVLGWAVFNNEGFQSVLVEAVLLQLVTMILIGDRGGAAAVPPARGLALLGDHPALPRGTGRRPRRRRSSRSCWPGSSSSTSTTPTSASTRVTSSATARSSSAPRC